MRLPDIVRIQRILSATEIRKFDLLLHSHGGDYRVAYKVATMISNHLAGDGHSTVFVPLYCLSAATLLAMVGHELVISEPGWLGPIDPQLQIADIGVGSDQKQSRRLSSHTLQHVLQTLGNYIDESSAGSAKSRLFADYLLRPLTEEIDPFLVVNSLEYEKTVYEYGVRILARKGVSASLAAKAIQYLMSRPTHDYVIDAREISSSILNDVFTLVDPIHLPAEIPAAIETIFGEIMDWERTAEPEERAHPYMYSYDGRAVE
ncbi:hypothetical protein ACFLS5_02695 [Candidatus Bipolaricaulota bacterium]